MHEPRSSSGPPLDKPNLRMSDACCVAGTVVYTNNTVRAAGSVERCARSDLCAPLDAYVVGSGTTALVMGTDIFGFATPNMRANADMLAAALGCLVIVPDHFRGVTITSYLDGDKFTPAAIGSFFQSHGTWEATKADLLGARLTHIHIQCARSVHAVCSVHVV